MAKKHEDGGPARALPDTLIKQLNEADDARAAAAAKEADAKAAQDAATAGADAARAARADADAKAQAAVKGVLEHFGL